MKNVITILVLCLVSVTSIFSQTTADTLMQGAKSAEEQNDFAKALELYKKALTWYEQNDSSDKENYALCLHCIGRNYSNNNNNALAREFTQRALEIRKEIKGEVSEEYINSLNNIALSYFIDEDYSTAIELQERVCDLMNRLPKEHSNYGMYMLNMGRFYYFGGNLDSSAKAWEIALTKYEKYSELYEKLLSWLGMVYEETKDNKNLKRIMALMEDHNEHELTKPCNEPDCMLGRAEYYSSHRQVNKAKEAYVMLFKMEMGDALRSKAEVSYARFLSGIMNDHAGAADYYAMAAESYKKVEGENERYFQLLYSSSVFDFLSRNASACIEKADKVLTFYTGKEDEAAKKNLSQIHKTLGNAYKLKQDYSKSLEHYNKVLDYNLSINQNSKETADISASIAFVQRRLKNYDGAIEADERALVIYKILNDEENYRNVASDLELCYVYAGHTGSIQIDEQMIQNNNNAKLDEIIQSTLFQLPLIKEYMSGLDYAASLGTLAGSYFLKEDYQSSLEYYGQFIDNLFKGVREQFRMLDVSDRMNIWKEFNTELREMGELSYVYSPSDSSGTNKLSCLLYDAQLLSKGILLNSSIAFSRVLKESGKQELLSLYENIRENEIELDEMRSKAESEDDLQAILKLQREITAQQVKLYDGCAEFADYTEYVSYRWTDVQQKLNKEDVAIEFAAIGGPEDILPDDRTMFALVINSQSSYPEKIRIGKIKDLKKRLSDFSCFSDINCGTEVWGNIKSLLVGKKRIYFSADALFNSIGIEYLLVDGKPISEQFEVYRLSSTKELCYNHKKILDDNIVMIGDVDYGQMSQSIDKNHLSQLMSMRGFRESESGFAELPFTEKEINALYKIYQKKEPLVFRRQEATEDAFRHLDNKKVNLLHISTHGSYLGHDKSTDSESMELSLLALSGANLGSDLLENDGIISAADISTLNLRDCDLAVLSACQTGLGHQGDDGVFGLQRGFKNAGVHTLLITLSSVYDESTALLMEQFHKNFDEEQDKRKALVNAQQYLRSKGYNDPKYWAPFILLDAK